MINNAPNRSHTIKRTAILAALALVALPVAAHAAKDPNTPSLPGGVQCSYSVKKKLSAKTALRRGLPITVNCTGRASVGAGASLWGDKVEDYEARHYTSGRPGFAFSAPHRNVDGGKTTIYMKVRPWAKRFFRKFGKYAPFSAHGMMFTKQTDGSYVSFTTKTTRFTR